MSNLKTNFEITIEKFGYYPSETLRGILSIMSSPHEPAISTIKIQIRGEERTRDDSISSSFDKEILSVGQSVPIEGLFPRDRTSAVEIPFTFQLPTGIPPTFKSPPGDVFASINYSISVSVDLERPQDEPWSLETMPLYHRYKRVEFAVINRNPTPPSTIEPLTCTTARKLYTCMGCCFQRGTLTVKCGVDKNFYTFTRDSSVVNFFYNLKIDTSSLKKEIKSMHVSVVRGLHVATGYEGILERHRDLETLVEPISLEAFEQGKITLTIPYSDERLPWIIGTTLRSMYYVKLVIVTKDYPDDPFVYYTPLFNANTWPEIEFPANWFVGTAGRDQLEVVRIVYRTLAADMRIRTVNSIKIGMPKSYKIDVCFLKNFGQLTLSQIPL